GGWLVILGSGSALGALVTVLLGYGLGRLRDLVVRERRQREALQQAEARYERFIHDAPIGIYRTTPDGRYLLANPAAVRLAGCSGYRGLFESIPLPMWVYDFETLRFLAVNDAAVRQYGYSRDEFLAMTVADIRPPEDVSALRAAISDPEAMKSRPVPGVWRH